MSEQLRHTLHSRFRVTSTEDQRGAGTRVIRAVQDAPPLPACDDPTVHLEIRNISPDVWSFLQQGRAYELHITPVEASAS